MKTRLFSLFAIGLLFWQCSRDTEVTPPKVDPKIDWDQESIQLMQDLAPQLVGKWTLRQVRVKYGGAVTASQNQIPIRSDSTFQNLATLTIVPAAVPRTSPRDLRQGEYDGTIQYGSKTYPVQFNLHANAPWIVNKKGPQAFFLFEYRFPNGSHKVEPEEAFLENVGLVGDVFTVETTTGQSTMIWRGLNRGIEQIELVKQ